MPKKFDPELYLKENVQDKSPNEQVINIPVSKIGPNRYQPRKIFDKNALNELAMSIREKGVIQPVIVRKLDDDNSEILFELIAGERRLKASQLAGREDIPAIVRKISDRDLKILALVENDQRKDLSIIEKALSYSSLKEDIGAAEDIALATGLHVRTIQRYIRINNAVNINPDICRIFVSGAATVDILTAERFAAIADKINSLKKTNTREYNRIIKRLWDKGIKRTVDGLFNKVTKSGTGKIHMAEGIFRETEKEISINVRVSKKQPVSPAYRELIIENVHCFLKALELLKTDSVEDSASEI